MKKIILGLFVIIFFSIIFFVFINKQPTSLLSTYNIDGKIYRLLEAKNPIDWTKGLMFYKNKSELKGADGMIFIFPNKQVQSFWNENTYIDLDIYWMDDEKIIGKSFLPSILKSKQPVTVTSPGKVNRVMEIIF